MRPLQRLIPQWSLTSSCRCAATAAAAVHGQDVHHHATEIPILDLKEKFGRMGLVSHKKVGVQDLMKIIRVARTEEDYKGTLFSMNLLYNFGVKLKHRELASRLLAAAMNCRQDSEAVELIKLYSTWLEHPPDTALIYAVMGHFLDAGQPLVVREVAKAVREDWRITVEPPLYILGIKAMLQLPDDPVGEAMLLYSDARKVGVRLPAPLHTRLLSANLSAFETAAAEADPGAAEEKSEAADAVPSEAVLQPLRDGLRTAEGLAAEGHLCGGANASTLCNLAWLHYHLAALPEGVRMELTGGADLSRVMSFLDGDWVRILDAAVQNFGCHWGFSSDLPRGLFATLESSLAPEAARLVAAARVCFGRFYPVDAA